MYVCRCVTTHEWLGWCARNSIRFRWWSGRVVLRGVPIVNKHLVADDAIKDKVSALSVWTLWPDKRVSNVGSFHDKHLRFKPSPRVQAARNLKALFTFHTSLYLGRTGRTSNTPFTNLVTRGWLPNWMRPGSTIRHCGPCLYNYTLPQ